MNTLSRCKKQPTKKYPQKRELKKTARKIGGQALVSKEISSPWQSSYTPSNKSHQNQTFLSETSPHARFLFGSASTSSASGAPFSTLTTNSSCGGICNNVVFGVSVGIVGLGLATGTAVACWLAKDHLKEKIVSAFSKAREICCSIYPKNNEGKEEMAVRENSDLRGGRDETVV